MPPKRPPIYPIPEAARKQAKREYTYRYSFETDQKEDELDPNRLTNANGRKGVPPWMDLKKQLGTDEGFQHYVTVEYPIVKIPTACGRCGKKLSPPKKGNC